MDFWTAAISIITIVFTFVLILTGMKMRHQKPADVDRISAAKLEQLEKRIESLESIIIDLEKDKRFRDLE